MRLRIEHHARNTEHRLRVRYTRDRVDLRPILTLAWKDIRITLRYRTWFVASFIWPVILPLTFFFVGKGLAGPEGEGLESVPLGRIENLSPLFAMGTY